MSRLATTEEPAQASSRSPRGPLSWAPMVIVLLLPWMLLFGRGYQIGDPDTFWHIDAGDYLMRTWHFAGADPWSPFSSNLWVLHEWLPELVLALANRADGLGGVAWVWFAATGAVALSVFAACRRQGPVVLAALATVMALLGMWASLSARPQLVTFALAAVTTSLWLSVARGERRAPWVLIPLTWVWACSHGMWFVGPLLGMAVVLGMALDPARRHRSLRLASVPALSVAAAAVTPAGPTLLLAPLSVSGYTRFVSEWDPPSVSSPPMAITLLVLLVTATVWLRSRSRVDYAAAFVWVVALGWTLLYVRTVAVGAAIAAPLFVQALNGVASAHLPRQGSGSGTRRDVTLAAASAIVALGVAFVVLPPANATAARMPIGLDAQLDALPQGTVVMNEYGFGGWLEYAHPDLVPVIDERTEVFSLSYVTAYVDARARKPGWREFLARTKASVALIGTDSALADALAHDEHWSRVGESQGLSLLVAPGGL